MYSKTEKLKYCQTYIKLVSILHTYLCKKHKAWINAAKHDLKLKTIIQNF